MGNTKFRQAKSISACLLLSLAISLLVTGCRGFQYGHLVQPGKQDLVGSHTAGSEVYKPLVEESVAKLLGACEVTPASAAFGPEGFPMPRRVCFVGVENCSAEELGDFKEHLYELIDGKVTGAPSFELLSRRVVDEALRETRLRPESLLMQDNMALFSDVLQKGGQPIDYLLFAKLTSGTTDRNSSSQRDYLLTLDMIDVRTGYSIKEQAEIRKGYHKSPWARFAAYNIFSGKR